MYMSPYVCTYSHTESDQPYAFVVLSASQKVCLTSKYAHLVFLCRWPAALRPELPGLRAQLVCASSVAQGQCGLLVAFDNWGLAYVCVGAGLWMSFCQPSAVVQTCLLLSCCARSLCTQLSLHPVSSFFAPNHAANLAFCSLSCSHSQLVYTFFALGSHAMGHLSSFSLCNSLH